MMSPPETLVPRPVSPQAGKDGPTPPPPLASKEWALVCVAALFTVTSAHSTVHAATAAEPRYTISATPRPPCTQPMQLCVYPQQLQRLTAPELAASRVKRLLLTS